MDLKADPNPILIFENTSIGNHNEVLFSADKDKRKAFKAYIDNKQGERWIVSNLTEIHYWFNKPYENLRNNDPAKIGLQSDYLNKGFNLNLDTLTRIEIHEVDYDIFTTELLEIKG